MDDFDCDDFEKTLKVIVVGNGNVGKTSMTARHAKGRYTGNYKKTIGVDFMEKSVELRDLGETVNLVIWDTAGQEEFDTLTSRYKGADAVIYVFSTVDRDSFDDLPKWKHKVKDECGQICQVLVQNKIDLIDDAAMSRSEVEDMADFMNIRLFRSCVQDNVNVKEVFEHLCRRFLKQGGSGGDGRGGCDDSRHAVADISTLSERSGLKKNGSSVQRQHSSSSDLFHSSAGHDLRKRNGATREQTARKADNREEYDYDRTRPPSPQHPYESRAPTGKPFPLSVPASIADDRSRAREEADSDDDEGRDRDRRRKESRQRDDCNDRGRRERKPESHDDDCRSTAKTSKSDVSKQPIRELNKQRPPEEDATDDDPREDGLRSTATREVSNRTASARGEEEPSNRDDEDGVQDERLSSEIAAGSNTGLLPRKLQPSKRCTNGKKTRQSVAECVLS